MPCAGFCKQQLWPLFHYLLPLSPTASGRFDPELWQAYVKANKAFADKLVEVISNSRFGLAAVATRRVCLNIKRPWPRSEHIVIQTAKTGILRVSN